MTFRRARLPASLVALLLLAGCVTSTPTVAPIATPSPSHAPASAGSTGTTPPSVAPASPPPASPSPAETGWTEVWPEPTGPAVHLAAAISTGSGFVAAGADATGRAPVALSSADGSTWTAESIPGGARTPNALARWGDRLLATGTGEARCAHPSGLDTWVRAANGTWTEAPFAPILCDASTVQVATVGDVVVLAGSGPGDNPTVWSSGDGLHWVDRGATFAGRLPGGVVGDGTQAWVLGSDTGSTWIAYTTDGTTWTQPHRLDTIPEIAIRGVFQVGDHPAIVADVGGAVAIVDPGTGGGWVANAATGLDPETLGSVGQFDGGLFATGARAGGAALAWVSTDGYAWRSVVLPEALAGSDSSAVAVAVRGHRAILVGSVVASGGSAASRIWSGPASLVLP